MDHRPAVPAKVKPDEPGHEQSQKAKPACPIEACRPKNPVTHSPPSTSTVAMHNLEIVSLDAARIGSIGRSARASAEDSQVLLVHIGIPVEVGIGAARVILWVT